MLKLLNPQTLLDELCRQVRFVQVDDEHYEGEDRREAPRLEPVSHPIELEILCPSGCWEKGLLVDISLEGMRIIADSPLDCGQVVELWVCLGDSPIIVHAQVVHAGTDAELGLYGLRFLDAELASLLPECVQAWPTAPASRNRGFDRSCYGKNLN